MAPLQKVLDLLAAVSAFFSLLFLAILLQVMIPLGAFERTPRSDAALRAFDAKEALFGIAFFAIWTFLYYFLAKEFIPKIIAYFSSVLFLVITYASMFYTVGNAGYEIVALGGGAVTLFALAVVAKLSPRAFSRPVHFLLSDFLGINNLRRKFRIMLLFMLPFGIYYFFKFIPMVLGEQL